MTREEFIEVMAAADGPLPVKLEDGRMGLCGHLSQDAAIVDAYRGDECEQVEVAFADIVDLGGGALLAKAWRR